MASDIGSAMIRFFRSAGRKPSRLDDVVLDIHGAKYRDDSDGTRLWRLPNGQGIALRSAHGLQCPDQRQCLPGPPDRIDLWRADYETRATQYGVTLLSIESVSVDGCPAVKVVSRRPQPGQGMTYLGMMTIPFVDISFILMTECQEGSPTGLREAAVTLFRAHPAKHAEVSADPQQPEGSGSDPDDPVRLRALAEDAQYDEAFPDHPLSTVRRLLVQLENSVRIAEAAKASREQA